MYIAQNNFSITNIEKYWHSKSISFNVKNFGNLAYITKEDEKYVPVAISDVMAEIKPISALLSLNLCWEKDRDS